MLQVRHAALLCLDTLLVSAPQDTLGVLRTEDSTPLVAASAMMLQEAASAEAQAGHSGSKAVRVTALRLLRHLYDAVDDAQALSYVLPGAVGGLIKALIQGLKNTLPQNEIALLAMLPLRSRMTERTICRKHCGQFAWCFRAANHWVQYSLWSEFCIQRSDERQRLMP